MKTILIGCACLLLGLALGWHFGQKRAKHETADVVKQMLETLESGDAAETARAVRTIALIDSGETGAAVRMLATPIASYYQTYGESNGGNDVRFRLRVLIEDLVKTNRIVAIEMTNRRATSELPRKSAGLE